MHIDSIRCVRCGLYKPASEYFRRLRSDPRLRSHCKVCNRKLAPKVPVSDWIMSRVQQGPDCWIWTGSIGNQGYGHVRLSGWTGSRLVHRAVYTILVGPIPQGLDLDHVCHNRDDECPGGRICIHRRCVNPEHLVPTTRSDNVTRGRGAQRKERARMHRVRGHLVAD
jgi:hypothetical protein